MSKWIRKGDRVVVISGNDKGKAGEVLGRDGERVVIQGVNVRKKHLRRTQEMQGGRIVEIEKPIHISNVSICDADNRPIRLKVKLDSDNNRSLVYHMNDKEVVYRSVKKPS
jgi:large subunit ribosomal protein L24